MAQALADYRILDFTHVLAGPIATNYLRQQGADVIKVESAAGDTMRNYGAATPAEFGGLGPSFVSVNAGKRSIVLDLKNPEDMEVARRLVAKADVLVENFRPGVMRRLGLDFESCKALRPDLIYCSISGFGQSGPLRENPAIDQIVQSMSGLMTVSGEEGSTPMRVGFPIVDTFCGLLAAFSIVSSLLRRERYGTGQYIDLAMLDASMVMMISLLGPYLVAGVVPKQQGNRGYSMSPTADTFETADGSLTIGAVRDTQFVELCKLIKRLDLIADPRFLNRGSRLKNGDDLQREVTRALGTRSAKEWEVILNDGGVSAGAVRSIPEAIAHEHFDARRLKLPLEIPGRPATSILNSGFLFAEDPTGVDQPPPQLGGNAREILGELGYSTTEVESFFQRSTLASA